MSEQITYRNMTRDDYPTLIDILWQTWHTRPEEDETLQRKLAEVDFESCLARATCAQVACSGSQIVGVVLGRINAQETRSGLNSHHRNMIKLIASIMTSKEGRTALARLHAAQRTDRAMLKQAKDEGHAYDGEIVLLIVSPEVQGQGVGQHLFDWVTEQFKNAGVQHYFLCTDTGCDYTFYDRQGLARRALLDNEGHTPREDSQVHAEEDDLNEHLTSFMYDNEVSPANEGVNPLGRD